MFNNFHYYVDLLHKSSILSDDKRVDTKIKFWEGKWQRFRWLGSIFRVILTEMHSLYLTNDFSYGKISFNYYLVVNNISEGDANESPLAGAKAILLKTALLND